MKEFVQHGNVEDRLYYYRFGIIDFLQDYTKRKKLETMYLRSRYSKKDPNCFSCVDPKTYGDRFYDFLSANLFTPERHFPEDELTEKKIVGGSAGRIGDNTPSSVGSKTKTKFWLFNFG